MIIKINNIYIIHLNTLERNQALFKQNDIFICIILKTPAFFNCLHKIKRNKNLRKAIFSYSQLKKKNETK